MSPAPTTAFAVVRDGITLRGEVAGAGPAIVLLHGLTATRRYVVHGSRVLERAGFRVVQYDARGHGETGGPADPAAYGYTAMITDALAAMDHLGIARAVLAGHSLGAATAAGLALAHPDRVVALIAISPAHRGEPSSPEAQDRWDRLAAGLADGGADGFVAAYGAPPVPDRARATIETVIRQRIGRHPDPAALAAALRGVTRTAAFAGLAALARIACPTLVVASRDELDPEHPLRVAQEWARHIPGAEFAIEAKGESPLAWRGGSLSHRIVAFLARHAPPG